MPKVWKVPARSTEHRYSFPLPTYVHEPKLFYTLCERRDTAKGYRWVPISTARYADPVVAVRVFRDRLFNATGNAKPREIRPVEVSDNQCNLTFGRTSRKSK